MNTGVEILLQRMKDCPEDFAYQPHLGGMGRWGRLVDHAMSAGILTTEELDAIKLAQLEASRERFTELVMKELAGEGELSDEEKKSLFTKPQSVMGLGGVTQGQYFTIPNNATATLASNSLTLGSTTLQERDLRAMIDSLPLRKEPKKRWWNKTIPELLGKK